MNPLLTPNISICFAPPLVLVCQLSLLALTGVLFLRTIRKKREHLFSSLAFIFGFAFTVFYQIPSILYGGYVLRNMPEPYWFLLVMNIIPLLIIAWVNLTWPYIIGGASIAEFNGRHFGEKWAEMEPLVLLCFVALCCMGIYLAFIPWHCTGLWAILNDPESVLLARELTMKLNGTPFVNRIYGFFVNVVAPLVCFLGFYYFGKLFVARYFIRSILCLGLFFTTIPAIYIAGIKGALANTAIFLIISIISTPLKIWARAILSFFCICIFASMLLFVEFARERIDSVQNSKYDFAMCSVGFGACKEASILIKSAAMRKDGSLGLSPIRIKEYESQIEKVCPAEFHNSSASAMQIKLSSENFNNYKFISETYINPSQFQLINSAFASENDLISHAVPRNKLLNGDFRFWKCDQETYNGGSYRDGCPNMWRYYAKRLRYGEAVYSREVFGSGISGVPRGVNYLRWAQTKPTEKGVSSALSQQIPDVATLQGNSVVLSFYARANSDRVVSIQLIQNFEDGTKSVQGFSDVAISKKWNRFERSLILPPLHNDIAKGGGHLDLVFTEYSGESFVIDIARVQLEEGYTATPFDIVPLQDEGIRIKRAEEKLLFTVPQPSPRFLQLLESFMVRFIRVPFQVATWHFINAVDDTSIGWSAIPVLNRFQTVRRNISEEVYQKYGAIYSSGDVTSTSTAPTTFVLQYAAYIGWVGFALSMALIFALDYICRSCFIRLAPPLAYAFAGYIATVVFNMISSDFFTVLLSHGAIFGLFTFYLLNCCCTRRMPMLSDFK